MRWLGYLTRLGTVAVVVALCLAVVTPAAAHRPFAAFGGRPLAAAMTGAQEVPGPGDPDGAGRVKLIFNQGRGAICYLIRVKNITLPATAAHIHFAPAGSAGAVVVTLGAPDATGVAFGCVTGVDRWLIRAIRWHPKLFYVNVHTTDFPDGAVRGQLGWHAKPQ